MGTLGPSRGGGARRGRRAARRGRLSEINVTPFVDVMLVLLIVFMVTAPLLAAGVEVDLPPADAKPLPQETAPLSVTVHTDGQIFVQDTPVTADALVDQLRALAHEGYDRRIFVRADRTADYGIVVDVMARMNRAGFRNIGLVTDPLHATAAATPAKGE